MEQELTDHDVIELERRAREMTSLIFALSEKRGSSTRDVEISFLDSPS